MVLLDDFLFDLFLKRKIQYQTMMMGAQNPSDLQQKVMEYTQRQSAAAGKKK